MITFLRWFFAFGLLNDRYHIVTRGLPLTPELQQAATVVAVVSSVVVVLWALRVRGALPAFVALALTGCAIEAVGGVFGHMTMGLEVAIVIVLVDRTTASLGTDGTATPPAAPPPAPPPVDA